MKIRSLLAGTFLMVLLAGCSGGNKEVINASKLFFGEMLIEYPEDLEIAGAKIKVISRTDDYVKYNLTGYVEKNGRGISEIDVDIHENLKKTSMGKWVMKCNSCPERVNPPEDINSEKYKKWEKLLQRVHDEG